MNKTLNFRYLIRIVAILGLLAVAVWLVHRVQAGKVVDAFLHQADAAEERDDLGHAINYLRRLLVIQPNNTDARARLALLMEQIAQTKEDFNRVYLEMEQVLRENGSRDDVRKREIFVATRLGYLAEALKNTEILVGKLKEKPKDEAALQELAALHDLQGQCLEGMGQNDEARKSFEQAIGFNPKQFSAYGRLAHLIRQLPGEMKTKEANADAVVADMLAKNPKSATAHLVAAGYRNSAGDSLKYATEIEKARDCDPTDPEVILAFADVEKSRANKLLEDPAETEAKKKSAEAEAKKKFADTCLLLDRAIQHNLPKITEKVTRDNREQIRRLKNRVAEMFFQLGSFQVSSDQLTEAEKTLKLGIKTFPGFAQLREQLIEVYIARRQWDEGRKQLDELSNIGIEAWASRLISGRLAMGKGKWFDAAQELETAVSGAPAEKTRQIYALLGESYARMGMLDRCYESYHRAVPADSRGKDWARASMREAGVLVELGRTAEAKAIYEQIATRFPNVANLPLARLLWLESRQSPPDKERLLAQIDELLKQAQPSVERELFKATYYANDGKHSLDSARAALNDAIKNFPDAAEPWAELAFLEWKQKDADQARRILTKAEAKFPKRLALFRLVRAQMVPTGNLEQLDKELNLLAAGSENFEPGDRQRLLRGLAQIAQSAGARDVADQFWDQLAKESPHYLPFHLIRFDNAIAANNEDRIKEAIWEVQKTDRENLGQMVEALYQIWRARHLKDKSGLSTAKEALAKLERIRPGWSRVAVAQAMIDELTGKPDAALAKYRQAIDLGERNPDVIRRAVEMYYEQKQPIEAERMMRRLPKDAVFASGFEQIAAELSIQGRNFANALALAEKAVPADTKDYRKLLWRSRIMWQIGNEAEAEKSLNSAITISPKDSDAWIMLVQLRMTVKAGQKRDRALIENTLKEAESNIEEKDRQLAMAQCYEIAAPLGKEFQEHASKLYDALDKGGSDDLRVLKSLANFRLREGKLDEARKILKRVVGMKQLSEDQKQFANRLLPILIAANRDYAETRKKLTEMGLIDSEGLPTSLRGSETIEDLRTRAITFGLRPDIKYKREAIKLFEEIRARQGLRDEDRMLLAQLNSQVGDWLKAQAVLKPLLDEGNEPTPAQIALYCAILINQKKFREADPWVVKLEKVQPDMITTIEFRARILAASDQSKARDFLLKQMEKPKISPIQIAQLLEKLGSAAAAEPIYRRLANLPDSPNGRLNLALYLGRQSRIDEALEVCGLAWKDGDPERVAQTCVGVLYSAQEATAEQIKRVDHWIQDAIGKNSLSLSLKSSLAALRNLQKDYDATIALYREVVAGNSRDMVALNNLAYLLSAHQGKHEDALSLITSAKRTFGPVPTFLDTEAQICIAKGDYSQAISLLNEAISSEPSASHYFHLAQAYYLNNNQLNAKGAWTQAMKFELKRGDLHQLEQKQFNVLKKSFGVN